MAISGDIYNAFAPKVTSPQEVTNGLMQQANAAAQMQDSRLAMQQKQRAIADDEAMRADVRASGGDPAALRAAIIARGNVGALDTHDKTQAEIAAKKAGADKDATQNKGYNLDNIHKSTVQIAERWATVRAPQDVIPLYVQAVNDGLMSREKAEAEINKTPQDPAQFQAYALAQRQQGMTVAAQMKQKLDEQQRADQVQQWGVDSTERKRYHQDTTATQRRGQDKVDERMRDSNAAALSKPFEVTGEDGTSRVLVQQDKQGNLKPVTGYSPKGVGGPDKLTEVQANATSFVSRMRDSSGTIDKIEDQVGRLDTQAARSVWTNWLATPAGRQYAQAQRNWVTANLRKESGAAIPDSELDNEYKKWFPVLNDDAATIAQKRQARKVAEEAMTVQAGPGAKQVAGILDRGGSPAAGGRTIKRTGTDANGKKVVEYSDGKIEHAN